MNSFLNSLCLLALSTIVSGCVEEGHSADCGVGGRGNQEDDGCVTPVGGACLTEAEFKESRPAEREDEDEPDGVATIDDDWYTYQLERELCVFPCVTEEEFRDNRSESRFKVVNSRRVRSTVDDDWNDYVAADRACSAE